ncbi:MFS transporter [Sphingomonas sp. MMS24-J13]|uniref:MFS transporter n=1 Tax=Sphingomonas sp. MMS24-J13 TaxID=3238686 RepID=UPI00384DFB63
MSGTTIDIQAVIDRQPSIRRQIPLLVVMTLVMFIDGYDVFMLGRIAPAIADEFGEPATRLTLVFVLQQVGLAVGSFVIGPLSDRYGRKSMLMLSSAVFGVLTLGVLYCHTLTEVAILRGSAGFFLAGVIPNATALLTEFTPPGRRASFVSIAFTGYTAGGAAASFAALSLLKHFGWRSTFWLGGLIPLLLVPLVAIVVRESLQFRFRRNPADRRIARDLVAIEPDLVIADTSDFTIARPDNRPEASGLTALFRGGRAPVTLLLWAAYFIALGMIALLASWSATFFLKLDGVPLDVSAAYSLLSFIAGVGGTTTVGLVMDRLGRARVLTILFVIDAVSIGLMGLVPYGGWAFVVLTITWGYAQAGAQGGLNALCAQAYPSAVRSTGIGWAFGLGRLGGVALPALGGWALANHLPIGTSFMLAGALPLLVALTLVGLGRLDARGRFAQ